MLKDQHFVAHIDILGMSKLVEKDPALAWDLLSLLVQARNDAHRTEITFLDTAERITTPNQIWAVTFSDTIVLFTKFASLTDLRAIVIMTTELLNKALHLCVPVRAGIAVGTFFFNLQESMYAGPALIEAYHLGEEAQWIGITTSEEVYRRASEANFQSGKADVVVRAYIPIKGGTRDGYAVNWPAILRNSIGAKLPVCAEQVYEGFAQYFGPFEALPPNERAKYEHTAWFINQMGT
ncbi:MAG: hypothetical protein C4575_11245 [Desulforudis sp.]|jgi:hypothetical protein|nr:MAG: hypothetical protein C4575_11245 [Desulforudis sp.]